MTPLTALAAALIGTSAAPATASTEVDGTAIAVSVDSSGGQRQVELKITDAVSGQSLRDAEPLGWLYPDDAALSCKTVIAKASNGALGSPGINLNSLRIATAFADGSLGMVDPQTSFAGTQLESAFDLGSPARTIAANSRGDRLAVVTQAGKLRLIDTKGVMREIVTISVADDATVAWDGDRLIVAGGKGIAVFSGDSGASISSINWPLVGKPLLHVGPGQGLLLASESGPIGTTVGARFELSEVSGFKGARDAVWLAKSAAWAIATAPGSLVLARPGHAGETVSAVSDVRAVASDSEGRFVLAAIDGGANLALIDAADGRILDARPLPEKAEQITVSRDFAYVYSGKSANVELVSFEVARQQHRISTVELPFGSERAAEQTPFARVGVMPGGAAVIGQDGKTLFAYAEGMMVPMGSFAGITRPLLGLAVLDRSLREAAPGVYRTTADVRFGGHYRLPLRLGNPRIDACLTVVLPGPERIKLEAASNARFERAEMSASMRQPVEVGLAAPAGSATILALATDTLGRWQKHFPLQRTASGRYAGRVSFPAPGTYRLIALDARANVSVKPDAMP